MSTKFERLEKKVAQEPKDAQLRMDYGIALAESGQPGAAAEQFEDAIKLDGMLAEAHYNLGVLYGRCLLHDLALDEHWEDVSDEEILFENALLFYTKALKLDPKMTRALNNLARLHAVTGRTDEARAYFEESLAVNPRQAKVKADLAALG